MSKSLRADGQQVETFGGEHLLDLVRHLLLQQLRDQVRPRRDPLDHAASNRPPEIGVIVMVVW